jgi:hypothetical protein
VLWIRIYTDPHHLAGSRIFETDPDTRLQNLHLINPFSEKRIVNKFKYIYANFSVHKKVLYASFKQKFLVTKFYIEQDLNPVFFRGRIRIRIKIVWICNTAGSDTVNVIKNETSKNLIIFTSNIGTVLPDPHRISLPFLARKT